MRGEVLKGHLDALLLAVVADEPAHGYLVVERLRRRSGGVFEPAEGTVYPALYRLEAQGLLASSETRVAGRRRRVYRITGRGARELQRRREEWRGFAGAVNAVLGEALGLRR